MFAIPWEDRVYVGTTDTSYKGSLDAPCADDEDVAYVVDAVAQAFPGVGHDDVVTTWAGLRPLAADGGGVTADLSRKHAIYEEPPGLLNVTGGKLTTYRAMAEDAIDRISRRPCVTALIPLGLTRPLGEALAAAEAAAGPAGRRLVRLYGDDWVAAHDLLRVDPTLAEPYAEGAPALAVEAVMARAHEMALTDEDVHARRLRLASFGVGPPG
jgi:glycerol-3-phosphate dehydrogenase